MTPVDIDKLKELLADDAREQDDIRYYSGPDHRRASTPKRDALNEWLRSNATALIAKAERVDAMEAALKPFAERCQEAVHPSDDDRSGLTVRVEYLRAARNALSPKPEISDPTKRMEKILGATFTRKAAS